MGKLPCLNLTIPDVSYAIQHLSQFLAQPRVPHMEAAINVVKYLKGTINRALFYPTNSDLSYKATLMLIGVDVCLAASLSRATAFSLVNLSCLGKPRSKRLCPSHLPSLSIGACLRPLASSYGLLACYRTYAFRFIILFHSTAIIRQPSTLPKNPVFHNRTKHIDVDCHYVRDKVLAGFIHTQHLRSSLQLADIMTKPLGTQQHHFLSTKTCRHSSKSNLTGGVETIYFLFILFLVQLSAISYIQL